MSQAEMSSFDEALVRAISSSLNEPSWLTDSRLEAYRMFVSLPPEKNPLYTKYARTFSLPLDQFKLTSGRSRVDFRTFFGGYLTGRESDILLQRNETQVHAELEEGPSSKGISLTSFHEALGADEALVRKLVEKRLVKSEGDKYAAFVNAFFNSGLFVRVPRGVSHDTPLRLRLLLDSPNTPIVAHNFILAVVASMLVFL